MEKKYALTEETIKIRNKILYRIRALRDFGGVKAGDIGGFIESEANLSHSGDSWVYDNGKVYDNGEVRGNGIVRNYGKVYGYGIVCDNSEVYDNGEVYGYGIVRGNGRVYGYSEVHDCGEIYDCSEIYDHSTVCDNGKVYGYGTVYDHGIVCGNGILCGSGILHDYVVIKNEMMIKGGEWTISPLYIQGSRHSMNMCTPNKLRIGCQEYGLENWLKEYQRIGQENYYTQEEIEEYKDYIDLFYKRYGSSKEACVES